MKIAVVRGKEINTDNIRYLLVEGESIDIIRFQITKEYEGIDLSTGTFYCVYQLPSGNGDMDVLEVSESADGSLLYLDWDVTGWPLSEEGNLMIQLSAYIGDQKWKTKQAILIVEESLDPEDLGVFTPSVLDQYLTLFQGLETEAESHKNAAAQSEASAANSATAALASEQAADGSAGDAAASAAAALASEQAAGTSEDNAAASAAAALASEQAADGSAGDAAASAAAALASEQAAGTSEDNAAASAAAALASEQAADGSAGDAAASAAAALASEQAAGTSEDNAAASAAAALASEQAADGSAGDAAASAAAALASEQAAGTSEDNAAASAAAALASEQAADGSAGDAADSAASALASKVAAEAAAASVQMTSYYGLRRRSDGVYTRTGAASGMTPARSNGTYNPTVSDFRTVKPWADIRLCLLDKIGNVAAIQGDDNFSTYAAETNPDGTHVYNFGSLFTPFYMKIWEGVDGESYAFKEWDVSALKLPGYEACPAFVREDGTIRPYIVINSFKTGMDTDGKICSKPGTVPLTNTSTLSFDTHYSNLDPSTNWLGNHFTTNDVWKILVCIEFGTMDIQSAVGLGISSSMPYSSSTNHQLTAATTDGNSVTIVDAGQPFYVGMDVQIGTSYSNSSYASNRKITDVDTTSVPGYMIITVDGDPFSAPIGGWIVTWGQSDTATNLLQIGTGCGWISQWGTESRSHVYIYGLVDPYANVYEVERGKMRKAKHFWINFNPLASVGVSDPEASGYTDCGEFSTGEATYGWISDFQIVTLGIKQMQLVSAVGGNSIGDVIYYADDARTGTYVCFRGGGWSSGSSYGPFCGSWGISPTSAGVSRGDRGIILEPALQAA